MYAIDGHSSGWVIIWLSERDETVRSFEICGSVSDVEGIWTGLAFAWHRTEDSAMVLYTSS